MEVVIPNNIDPSTALTVKPPHENKEFHCTYWIPRIFINSASSFVPQFHAIKNALDVNTHWYVNLRTALAVKPARENKELHRTYWIPRVFINTASNFVPQFSAARNALDINTSWHEYNKSANYNHLLETAIAVTLLVNSIFCPSVAGILNDCHRLTKYAYDLGKEENQNAKCLLILAVRITIRVASIFSIAIPAIFIPVQVIKIVEGSFDTYWTLKNAKDITPEIMLESANDGIPTAIRCARLYSALDLTPKLVALLALY